MKMKVFLAILLQGCAWTFAQPTFQLEMGLFALLPIIGHSRSEWRLLSEDPKDTKFLLYSNKFGMDAPEHLDFRNMSSITHSQFKPQIPTKFIIHGFMQGPNSCHPRNILQAYLTRHPNDFNLIVVDWSLLAIPRLRYIGLAWYATTAFNAVKVGERIYTGDFIIWLHNKSLIDLDTLHLNGFSLGAHLSGKAGAQVQAKLGKSIGRITGLDPAGPLFYTIIFARSLSPGDAIYVDVIHTNSDGLGMWGSIGHVDFFVNGGGGLQPGCVSIDAQMDVVTSFALGSQIPFCSHLAATSLYADSILAGENLEDFTACACFTAEALNAGACACDAMVTFGEYSTPV